MNKIVYMLESAGFAEEQVLHAALQLDVLHAFEPHQLTLMRPIEERRAQPLCLTDTYRVPFGDLTDDLHVRIFIVQFGDLVDSASVDILIGILPNQVERRMYAQLFTKNVGTLRTDILTICYISMR